MTLGIMTDADILGAIWQSSGSKSENLDSDRGSLLVEILALVEVCCLSTV